MRGRVVISPSGGLGNQLFIWAAGYALSRDTSSILVSERGDYRQFSRRKNQLKDFDSGIEPCPMCHSPGQFFCRNKQSCRSLPTFVERRISYDASLATVSGSIRLDGFFQNLKYFSGYRDDILNRLGLSRANEIGAQTRHRAVIHVRRTDFLEDKNQSMGVLGEVFFRSVLEHLTELGFGFGDILIFTDSVKQAREIRAIRELPPNAFIGPKIKQKPIEVLRTIASADALAMSNSSFSWWAGLAVASRGRPVLYPKPWSRKGERDPTEAVGPSWSPVSAAYESDQTGASGNAAENL